MATPQNKVNIVPGYTIAYTNATGGTLNLGDSVQVGCKHGVLVDCGQGSAGPNATLINTGAGTVAVKGTTYGPAKTSEAWIEGQPIWWDSTNTYYTATIPTTSGWFAGRAFVAKAAATAYGIVDMNEHAPMGCVPMGNQAILTAAMPMLSTVILAADASFTCMRAFNTNTGAVRAIPFS